MKKADEKGSGHLKEWLIFLSLCGVGIAFFGYRGSQKPVLTAYGIKDWQTVCEREGRIYRLKSQNTTVSRGTYTKKSRYNRNLQFLDEEGKILYLTARFDSNSLDKDGVWRFQYWQGERLADRMFRKTKNTPFLQKILSKIFQADWKKYKDKNPGKALYGDEETFEIARDFKQLSVIRKDKESLDIPCQPL